MHLLKSFRAYNVKSFSAQEHCDAGYLLLARDQPTTGAITRTTSTTTYYLKARIDDSVDDDKGKDGEEPGQEGKEEHEEEIVHLHLICGHPLPG